MNATISMEGLWQMIQSLSFNNRKWLADKLVESVSTSEAASEEERKALLSAFKQVKALKEGKLETRPIEELFKELEHEG